MPPMPKHALDSIGPKPAPGRQVCHVADEISRRFHHRRIEQALVSILRQQRGDFTPQLLVALRGLEHESIASIRRMVERLLVNADDPLPPLSGHAGDSGLTDTSSG